MRRRPLWEEAVVIRDGSQSWLAHREECAHNRRMKTVERWGNDRFVRMVNSQKPSCSEKLVNLRSQLMRKVVRPHQGGRNPGMCRMMRIHARVAAFVAMTILSFQAAPSVAQSRWSGSQTPATIPICRSETPLLTTDSIGPFHPRQTLEEVEALCPELHYGWMQHPEGDPSPSLSVQLGEAHLVLVLMDTLPGSRVWSIGTASPGLRTEDGFGPGSSVVEMIEAWGEPRFVGYENMFGVRFESHRGLRIDIKWSSELTWPIVNELEATNNPELVPPNTVVSRVAVYAVHR